MANIILDNSTKSFLDDFHIKEKKEDVRFEHFVNYCVISKLYSDAYTTDRNLYEEVHTGAGGDLGIDGILVTVNDVIVNSKRQVDDVLNMSHNLAARFVFIQAKTSSAFDTGDMLKTGNGVLSMFDFNSPHTFNEKVKRKFSLIKYIFSKSSSFSENPECLIFYVTQGKWVGDNNQMSAIDSIMSQLVALGVFSNIVFKPIDGDELIQTFRAVNNQIVKVLPFPKRVSFPTIQGVEQAYIGLVSAIDFIKLITDSDGYLQRSLFYENVRGFLGDNPVNSEIASTINDDNKKFKFPILNNGVTIVTRELLATGDDVKLTDFQIVNGCQTSNVLYKMKSLLTPEMMIPIKVITTDSPDVVAEVVKSTNRQTNVTLDAFESLKPFHKKLQDYYRALESEYGLYYERRVREYDRANGAKVKRYLVVSLASQLYSSVSMFFNDPHSTHRYYGELLRSYTANSRIFQDNHVLDFYYVSELTLAKVESAFYHNDIDASYKPYRYHLLMLLRILILRKETIPPYNSHALERDCKSIMNFIKNKAQFTNALIQACSIIDACTKNTKLTAERGNALNRRKEFTQELMDLAKANI